MQDDLRARSRHLGVLGVNHGKPLGLGYGAEIGIGSNNVCEASLLALFKSDGQLQRIQRSQAKLHAVSQQQAVRKPIMRTAHTENADNATAMIALEMG